MARLSVSVSGGRTSAYMARWVLVNQAWVADRLGSETQLDLVFTFANTGMEDDDTLRFMRDVDHYLLDDRAVWLEAVPFYGRRVASGHREVDFETAFRNNQWEDPAHPFHAVIRKYGVPNKTWQLCTRELKLNPMKSYLRSIGWAKGSYSTAVGIREDESRRVSAEADGESLVYPLTHWSPTVKDDVLDFFKGLPWDLKIPEHRGNCVTCHKKSLPKLGLVFSEEPQFFDFNEAMERQYGGIGPEFAKHPESPSRVFFRGRTPTTVIRQLFTEGSKCEKDLARLRSLAEDGGCSESCEVYETTEGVPTNG